MSKSKFIAGLTSVAIFATSLSVVPTASAVQLHSEERSGRPICVATLSDRETQVAKDYFQAQIDEYLKLQERLRAAYPQFSDLYVELDRQIEESQDLYDFSRSYEIGAITTLGFTLEEASIFFFKGTLTAKILNEAVDSGFPVEVEIIPGWTQNELIYYPYSAVPAISIVGDPPPSIPSINDSQVYEAYKYHRDLIPTGVIEYYMHTNVFRPFVQAYILAVSELKAEFEASFSTTALRAAAVDCLESVETGEFPPVEAAPTTTYSPTVTVTADPSTIVETPAPVTSTKERETVSVTPAPVTSTAVKPTVTVTVTPEPMTSTAPVETIVETPAPVTSTAATQTVTVTPAPVTGTKERETVTVTPAPTTSVAPVETIVETPAPVTSTAATETATVTPAPVTSTKERETVTVTPEPTTSVAPVETIVETPAPVTSTAATETATVTPAPVTTTKERETVTVTPAPATSTEVKPTVTVTAEPTTVTTTPTVTVSADPVEVTESKDAPEEKESEGMGVLPIIVAILAAIGGIAGIFLGNPAILQGLI